MSMTSSPSSVRRKVLPIRSTATTSAESSASKGRRMSDAARARLASYLIAALTIYLVVVVALSMGATR